MRGRQAAWHHKLQTTQGSGLATIASLGAMNPCADSEAGKMTAFPAPPRTATSLPGRGPRTARRSTLSSAPGRSPDQSQARNSLPPQRRGRAQAPQTSPLRPRPEIDIEPVPRLNVLTGDRPRRGASSNHLAPAGRGSGQGSGRQRGFQVVAVNGLTPPHRVPPHRVPGAT